MRSPFRPLFTARLHEFMREFGVLWLVFSVLDRLVGGTLTALWLVSNVLIGIATWLCGIYIEWREDS